LIAECFEKIREIMELLTAESEKLGLETNTNKTKIMPGEMEAGIGNGC
jgi:hypothetical protein